MEHPWQYCKYLVITSILETTSILVIVSVCRVVSMPVHARLIMEEPKFIIDLSN